MRDAALVRHGDLAVEYQLAARGCQLAEWRSEQWRAIKTVAADQRQLPACVNNGDQPVAISLISCSQPLPVGGFAAGVTICSRRDGDRPARTAADGMLRVGMGDANIDYRASGLQPSLV